MPSLTLHQPEVPRLLAGTQTAIVRPINPQPKTMPFQIEGDKTHRWYEENPDYPRYGNMFLRSWHMFTVGAPLWCRETWLDVINPDTQQHVEYRYRADGSDSEAVIDNGGEVIVAEFQWRSPVTMPREASRITVTPTAVRVCRTQDVTEEEAKMCGMERDPTSPYWYGSAHKVKGTPKAMASALAAFRDLWDCHNPHHQWASNPWVVVANVDVDAHR